MGFGVILSVRVHGSLVMPFAHHVDGPDALCSWLVRPFVRASVHACVRASVQAKAFSDWLTVNTPARGHFDINNL